MKCRFCREELPEGAKFCPICGTPVEPEEEETREQDQGQWSDGGGNPYQYGAPDGGQYQYGQPNQNQGGGQYQYGQPNQNQGRDFYQYGTPDRSQYQYEMPDQGGYGQHMSPVSGTPYIILSIFTLLMCCMPLGIVAVIYASKINTLQRTGDYAGAQEAAKKAKLFSVIGIIGGIFILGILLAVNLSGFSIMKDDYTNEYQFMPETEEEDREASEAAGEEKKTLQPAAPNSELGATWDTFTVQINDKTVTLPCTIEEIEAAGLEFDTEDTPEDYIVNASEYVMIYFEDENDNYIMAEAVNRTDKAVKIRECLIGGISVSEYGISEGGITVLFPGGLTIGSSKADMLSKYGETDDVYEGDTFHMYTWYKDGLYDSSCEIDLDAETGAVTDMSMRNYGE